MVPAVQFNNQVLLETHEVNEVWTNRTLSSKLISTKMAITNLPLQRSFGICG